MYCLNPWKDSLQANGAHSINIKKKVCIVLLLHALLCLLNITCMLYIMLHCVGDTLGWFKRICLFIHIRWDCKDDLKHLKYDDHKNKPSLLPKFSFIIAYLLIWQKNKFIVAGSHNIRKHTVWIPYSRLWNLILCRQPNWGSPWKVWDWKVKDIFQYKQECYYSKM